MIYISDNDVERFLLEDIGYGDLTTRTLGIKETRGRMEYISRGKSIASGVNVAQRILKKLGITILASMSDGDSVEEGGRILCAEGDVIALQQGWKVVQNVLEWSCGVAYLMSLMVQRAREENPTINIACTRKNIPGTKLLSIISILNGGGIIHRLGISETVVLFKNHQNFLPNPLDWEACITNLRHQAPEKKIVIEAESFDEACSIIVADPDIVQLDKFSPEAIKACIDFAKNNHFKGLLAAAGGIHLDNVHEYATTGISLLVTSAPYHAKPADISVVLQPIKH